MTDYSALAAKYAQQLLKALKHLRTSYAKAQKLPVYANTLKDEELEVWESFVARFGRAADIFQMKYLRVLVLQQDPGFRGSFRDCMDAAEKLEIIDDASLWMDIRELRNKAAHEYLEEDLAGIFDKVRNLAPHLLALDGKLQP